MNAYAQDILNESYSHMQNMPQPHRQSTKLRNMIVNIEIELLIKLGTSGMSCEEFRAKKQEMCIRTTCS